MQMHLRKKKVNRSEGLKENLDRADKQIYNLNYFVIERISLSMYTYSSLLSIACRY